MSTLTAREKIAQRNKELFEAREKLNQSLPKFIKGEMSAFITAEGLLEISCDAVLDQETTDKFIEFILNYFVRKNVDLSL